MYYRNITESTYLATIQVRTSLSLQARASPDSVLYAYYSARACSYRRYIDADVAPPFVSSNRANAGRTWIEKSSDLPEPKYLHKHTTSGITLNDLPNDATVTSLSLLLGGPLPPFSGYKYTY